MKRKLQSITSKGSCLSLVFILLLIWQLICMTGWVPEFMLPSPVQVVQAFVADFPLLMNHTWYTLQEAILGLSLGIFLGVVMAMLMDRFELLYQAAYPLVILSQTIPTVAIAPLLVLWFGYEMLPKVILIVLTTFFPIAVGLLDGLRSADCDTIHLLRSMGASRLQILRYVKLPGAVSHFFAGLRISVSYSMVGAVVSEWIGGVQGLGVYMTRVKKSYRFDKMFAVIFLISGLSLLLMWLVDMIQKRCMAWKQKE